MSARKYEEVLRRREEFLKRENEALNRHKGELIDKVWALEIENKRLREALEKIANHNIFVIPQIDVREFARKVLNTEGDSNA